MKITSTCIPCLLSRLLYETNLVDSRRSEHVLREACGIISSNLTSDICSAELATQLHGRTYEILETDDPYKVVKATAMTIGLKLQSKAESILDNSPDRLHAAIICSIVGNVMDFGIDGSLGTPEELVSKFDEICQEGLGYEDIDKLKIYLKEGAKIVFFTDNCGEIVFDKLLCQELKQFKVHIILVVKGEPILSDATLEEAEEIGMEEVVDEIITTGDYAVGVNTKPLDPVLEKQLLTADIIISKGMANFEALSETNYKPILYLMRIKCGPVAEALDLPKNLNVAKLIE